MSFGLSQRIVAYHYLGDGSPRLDNVLAVRAAVFANPYRDLREMARKLAVCRLTASGGDLAPVGGDVLLAALVVYNCGSYPPPGSTYWTRYAGNVASYRAALAQAARLA